jgi:Fe-S cluster assembly protein SufD
MVVEAALNSILPSTGEGDRGNAYLKELLRYLEGQKVRSHSEIAGWLQELRQRAAYNVTQQRMPHRKDEEWRFTDVSGLQQHRFTLAPTAQLSPTDIQNLTLPEATESLAVFVNGRFAPELSNLTALPEGIFVGNLAQLPVDQSLKLIKYFGHIEGANEVFTALNTVGFPDVAMVWLSQDVIVEQPVHLLFVTVVEDEVILTSPRAAIIAEPNSSLEIVEHYAAITPSCPDQTGKTPYWTNAVTEIWVEENAQINHTRNQRESGDGFHIGKTAVAQNRNSRYTCNALSLGAKLSRHNLEVWQQGEQTETTLNGLTIAGREQVADTHSLIALNHPHGTTNQLHKCVIDDTAHAIFNGKVYVPKNAQLTNAAQLNRNLLLSPKARVDTKPQLQITADNVKCTHGATISQIEADELFYLQSRGINADSARSLLLDAFAAEILNRVPIASLRQRLAQCVACRTYE